MEIVVEWHDNEAVAEIVPRFELRTPADVAAFEQSLFEQLDALVKRVGQRVPLMICIDHIVIDPGVADDYGKVARAVGETYVSVIARYGAASKVQRIVALEAASKRYSVNLFESREDALNHLQAHRH